MLTAETESGLLKAHNYWNKKRYGQMHLNFLSEHRASLEPANMHRHRRSTARSPNTRPMEAAGPKTPRDSLDDQHQQNAQPYVTVRTFPLPSPAEPSHP